MNVQQLIGKYWDKVKEHREYIHRHPELSNEEENTAKYIAGVLKDMGLEPKTGVGGFGITAVIQGGKPGKCIALRTDMDALPVTEATGLPFSSENPGVAHVCGHDTHMAMVLGAAYVLNEMKAELKGSVKLIFQPAEEAAEACGAARMIKAGALEDPKVDLVIGQHVWPDYPVGSVALKAGPLMASCDRFHITVRGVGAHGAAPQKGIDAIYIASQLVTALQSIVSRNLNPLEGAVVTVGSFHGGGGYNLVTDRVDMEGTVRTFSKEIKARIIERMNVLVPALAESLGGSAELGYFEGCEAVINPKEGFAFMKDVAAEVLGAENVYLPEEPTMIAEDFSFFGESVPAFFTWLGCRDPEKPLISLHNPAFFPEEETLKVGIRLMAEAAVKFLS